MTFEIIGIDHIYIAVKDLRRSEEWYDKVMPLIGFKKNSFQNDGDLHIQYYNRHFGFVIRPAHKAAAHDPLAPGLHHFCLRVESSEMVDGITRAFAEKGIACSKPQLYPDYAPDYYAIFFSDPDGIRLEITNYRAERKKRFAEWENA
jgi:catechol 2,3-dioxygenase-like lactoylglutathione lyase family enzyme